MFRFASIVLYAVFSFQCFCLAFEPFETKLVTVDDLPVSISVDISEAADLYLIATYGGDSYDYDQAIWGEPTLYDSEGNAVRLTSIKPENAQTGWGKMFVNENHQNKPLSISAEKIAFGFWAHAPSILHFKLDKKYKRFEARVGLDTASERGTVVFQVRDTPVPFPSEAEYTQSNSKPLLPVVVPVNQTTFSFNADAAKQLLEKGIEEILFIRRLTFTGNHIYTEYVNSDWMPGGGLCALNLKTGNVREIVPELTKNGVVGWFDLSFDAQKIVFDFKQGPDEGYRIYEVNVDGSNLRQLTFPEVNEAELIEKYRRGYHHGTDDMEPCYLPDGGIVFASTRCQFSVLCDSADIFTVKNLYRMNADGSNIKPLTYSALSEATPTMLSDGRILYHRWEYVDKSAGNAKALWSINPDGTGSAEVYGNSISFPETMIQAREIPGERNKIVMLGASHCCPNNAVGTVIVVDTSHYIRSPGAMRFVTDDVAANHHNGFHFKDEDTGEWIHDFSGKPGRLFRNPYPINGKLFLVSHKPKGLRWSAPAGYDLALLDESGKTTVLLKDPGVSLWGAYPLQARQRPPVASGSAVDLTLAVQGLARCIVTDVYVGMENVQRGDVKYIRILEQLPRPWSDRKDYYDDHAGTNHAHSALGLGMLSAKVQHGIVPVEEDGSANFVVPAGKAIYFQALDKNFCAIQTERTYVNYMPGEVRSCIGCHETPDIATPHVDSMPKAMLRNASIPQAQPTQNKVTLVFDYDRQIQPILDKHCVECHGGKKMQGDLDLRSTPQETFSVSYHALNQLARTEKQLLGFRKYRDEDAAMNGIEYIPPYQSGALSSPLAAMITGKSTTTLNDETVNQYAAKLLQSHPDLKLSGAERLIITNWLDTNCQYHPSYRGKLHAKFQNEPDYRPAFTFEDAQ